MSTFSFHLLVFRSWRRDAQRSSGRDHLMKLLTSRCFIPVQSKMTKYVCTEKPVVLISKACRLEAWNHPVRVFELHDRFQSCRRGMFRIRIGRRFGVLQNISLTTFRQRSAAAYRGLKRVDASHAPTRGWIRGFCLQVSRSP